jgi:glycosyltransferase involved in cell wall biosynthesis
MSTTPRFSIIIPSYNRGYVVWKAIQSVQAQTFDDWELIVVDDGSTDDTAKVVAQFQDDPRIRSLHQENAGANAARNAGLLAATGEFVGYLDSDDVLYPNCLATVESAFADPAVVFVISNYDFAIELCDADGRVIATTTDDRITQGAITMREIAHWQKPTAYGTGMFHRRQPVIDAGVRWDRTMRAFDDWDFILELARVFPGGYCHIPQKIYRYAQRYGTDGACSSVANYTQWADAFEAMWQKHKNHPLMAGQTWYPAKVEKYHQLQADFEAGRAVPPAYKYFPNYAPNPNPTNTD